MKHEQAPPPEGAQGPGHTALERSSDFGSLGEDDTLPPDASLPPGDTAPSPSLAITALEPLTSLAPGDLAPGDLGPAGPGEAPTLHAGGRIGPYELRGELARGGMGAVYRAFHPGLKREVALKVLLAGRDASPSELARFRREAEAAARLHHPGIVAIHDVGEDQGVPYLVMDLIEGQGLDRRLREGGPLPAREAAALTRDLASALAYAHARAILHRDLKPQNVLLDREGRPRITDFGLAKDLEVEEGLTRTGVIMGTPAYMPPEQARGDLEAIDRRADVYALGATLYEMLVGRAPFRGPSMQVLVQVLRAEPVRPRRLRPDLDRDLETICLRCLEKDPQRRYGTAQALADDLDRWLAGAPIEARPPGPLERLGKWARRNRALAGVTGGALALLLIGGATAAVLLPRRERERLAGAARVSALEAASAAAAPGSASAAGLGSALHALTAAQRWRALAPDDPAAAQAQLLAACGLAEVALSGGQWELARQCYEEAAALPGGADRGATGLARVSEARAQESRAHRTAVEAVLERARSGQLAREPEGLLDGVFALVRYPEPQTVALLADELEQVSRALLDLEREALVAATRATGDEAAWAGLPAALEARAACAGGEPLPPAQEQVWERACARAREALGGGAARAFWPLLAARQRAALGARLDAARVACDALGRIGSGPELTGGAPALGRFLESTADEDDALHAARALCRLGDPHGVRLVQRARRRFGLTGRLSEQIAPELARLGVELELEHQGGRGVYERGEARLAQGDLAGAAVDFQRALELEPELAGAWSNLGLVRQRQGDNEGALAAFSRALELAPGDGALHYNRAALLWRTGDVAGALAGYARAVELCPEDARFRGERALALESQGQLDAALAELDVALRLDPGAAPRWLQRGDLHLRRGDRARAGVDYEQALRLDPGNAQAWCDRGWLRRLEGDPDGAVSDLRRAVELDPGLAQAWDMLGNTLWGLDDAAGALSAFDHALELDPRNALTRVRRGFTCAALGRDADAIAEFGRALELQPGLPPALIGRGDARRSAGDLPGALLDYDAALAAHPELVAAWNNRGLVLMDLARPADALASFERGLAHEESPILLSNKGDALAALGQPAEAALAYERALALEPGFVEPLVGRARLRASAGDQAGARDDAAAALAAAPDDVRALLLRGRALRALGEREAALADLRHALALEPESPGLADEVAALER